MLLPEVSTHTGKREGQDDQYPTSNDHLGYWIYCHLVSVNMQKSALYAS